MRKWSRMILKAVTLLLLTVFCLAVDGRPNADPVNKPEENKEKAAGAKKASMNKSDELEKMLAIGSVRLSVKEAGGGTDMILIHGRTRSKEDMNPLFNHYKDKYHVVSYDVRGHGKTESGGKCTLDDLSDDLVKLIEAYQLKQPVVIGFSMGSYIALRTAERYPDLFAGIILIGTRGKGHVSQFSLSDMVADAMANFDNMTDISKVNVPALVLTGEKDFINPPEEGAKVAKALPDAKFKLVPNAGHEAYRTNPDFVFAQTDAFLNHLTLSQVGE